jgi:hypothetical protein
MGLIFDSNQFTALNSIGAIKFTTSRQMPHILYSVAGSFVIDKVIPTGSTSGIIERTDSQIVLSTSQINNSNFIVFPYYKISAGFSATGDSTMSGGGSVLLRVLKSSDDNTFLGSSVLNCVVDTNEIRLECVQTINRFNRYDNLIPVTGDDPLTVYYRIFYGRFE